MKIFYLLNCLNKYGLGHITRGLLLANSLKKQKIYVQFLLIHGTSLSKKLLKKHSTIFINSSNQKTIAKRINYTSDIEKVRYLIVDDSSLQDAFFKTLNSKLKKISICDGDIKPKNYDMIFDQSLTFKASKKIFSASKFLIIKKKPFSLRKKFSLISSNKLNISLFFGAYASKSKLKNIINSINKIRKDNDKFYFYFISNNTKDDFRINILKKDKILTNLNSNKFLKEISKSDLAIGEGGNAALERYIIGLPSLNFLTNNNQKKILNLPLDKKVFFINKSKYNNTIKFYQRELANFLSKFRKNKLFLKKNNKIRFDSNGSLRIAQIIKKLCI